MLLRVLAGVGGFEFARLYMRVYLFPEDSRLPKSKRAPHRTAQALVVLSTRSWPQAELLGSERESGSKFRAGGNL